MNYKYGARIYPLKGDILHGAGFAESGHSPMLNLTPYNPNLAPSNPKLDP